MLTVKQITLSGIEYLWEAMNVSFQPASRQTGHPSSDEDTPDRVMVTLPDGGICPVTGGTVFVMNDKGKTVSRYDLGASEIPQTESPMGAEGVNPHMTAHITQGQYADRQRHAA